MPAPAAPPEAELSNVLREYLNVTARLQETHQVLQQEVVRLREELASKDRELELRRRLAALGEMAAGVAHEVRNPLGAIQLYSDLLRTQCRQQQMEPALDLIGKIEAGIHAIEAVVQDTLALAPRDRQFTNCPLGELLDRVRDATLRKLVDCAVTLLVRGPEPLPAVRAEREGLQRVLVNLVVNAAEASPRGGTVEVAVKTVRAGRVEVCVRDEGPGLPDEVRHRIFDPFFTTKEHGTGLGLTIAHRLIEAYGGELRAGNQSQGGAEFVISLPCAEATVDPVVTKVRRIGVA
ncbi:MAG: sensor histidine kinase [Phycisphaerales bacterium]|nr:sensor histidine kinase [Phycisphaerales bacterium]